MSERLDPRVLFTLIASHVPAELHENILIVGSLAAAYHFRDQLELGGVNTAQSTHRDRQIREDRDRLIRRIVTAGSTPW